MTSIQKLANAVGSSTYTWTLSVDWDFASSPTTISAGTVVDLRSGGGTKIIKSGSIVSFESPSLGTGVTNAAYGNHTHTLSNMSDASITTPVDGNLIVYYSGRWYNRTPSDAGISVNGHTHALPSHGLGDHNNVSLGLQSNGYILSVVNGTWTGMTIASAGIASSTHNHSGVYEPVLGNPTTNGWVLSSTIAGVRSWVAPSGGISDAPATNIYGRQNATWVNLANSFANVSGSQSQLFSATGCYIGSSSHWLIRGDGADSLDFAYGSGSYTSKATLSLSGVFQAQELKRGSSRYIKHNIVEYLGSSMSMLNDTKIYTYDMNSDDSFAIGFIAEDTHQWLSGTDNKGHIFGNHLSILTKALQEEDTKIVQLQKEVLELQLKVKELSDGR
jgi:hypothetical protein